MPSDISRTSDEQLYHGVVTQQGRVILDRDFNALRETIDARIDADALDFVGPCGTPDNGFEIGPLTTPASPPLWTPPAPLTLPGSNSYDFSISPGTMYVGGQRAVFASRAAGQAIQYSYFDQPDWISPDPPSPAPTQEFIYLHMLEHEVSAVEDPELKDVALGGPDTTQRLRLVKRVKRLPVTHTDCAAALADAVNIWQTQGLAFDPDAMRLLSQATLMVTYSDPTPQASQCEPVAQGGYLGADNQLFRVQISDGGIPGGPPCLIWGCDNASTLYRARATDSTTLALSQPPVDQFHVLQPGQVVEVLRAALVINVEYDGSIPSVAAARGFISTVAKMSDSLTLILNDPLTQDYLLDTQANRPLFVRVWQNQITDFTPDGKTLYALDYVDGSSTGVQVQIGPSSGGPPQPAPIGAYWMFAVRPSTPQEVYPERYLISPQPPDGPKQWICPLGTIDWNGQSAASPPTSPISSGPVFHHCRKTFCNLVELSRRKLGGCCAVTLRPEDLAANPLALQQAADKFAGAAQGAAICLTPGTYTLTRSLRLDSSHNGLTIEACHGAVTLQAASVDSTLFQGLIIMVETENVTLKGITFVPPGPILLSTMFTSAVKQALETQKIEITDWRMLIGLRLMDCLRLKVLECTFYFPSSSRQKSFGAALFASGNCTGLSVRQCFFARLSSASLGSATDVPLQETVDLIQPITSPPTEELLKTGTTNAGFNAPADEAVSEGFLSTMIAAFLMVPSVMPETKVSNKAIRAASIAAAAILGEAEFIGNCMQGLDVPVFAATICGKVKFLDNAITDCFGGIWFACVQSTFSDFTDFQTGVLNNIPGGTGAANGMALAAYYPLPQESATRTATGTLSAELHLANNRIDAVPVDGAQSGPACLLYLSPSSTSPTNAAAGFDPNILLNSNQLRNSCMAGTAVAEVDTITPVIGPSGIHFYYIDLANNSQVVNYNAPSGSSAATVVAGLLAAWNANQTAAALASASGESALVLTAKTPGFPMSLSANVETSTDALNLLVQTAAVPGYGATAFLQGSAKIIVNGNLMRNLQTAIDDQKADPNSLWVGPADATIAVAGNILVGASNLTVLRNEVPRFSPASLTAVPELANLVTWKFLNNAMP